MLVDGPYQPLHVGNEVEYAVAVFMRTLKFGPPPNEKEKTFIQEEI